MHELDSCSRTNVRRGCSRQGTAVVSSMRASLQQQGLQPAELDKQQCWAIWRAFQDAFGLDNSTPLAWEQLCGPAWREWSPKQYAGRAVVLGEGGEPGFLTQGVPLNGGGNDVYVFTPEHVIAFDHGGLRALRANLPPSILQQLRCVLPVSPTEAVWRSVWSCLHDGWLQAARVEPNRVTLTVACPSAAEHAGRPGKRFCIEVGGAVRWEPWDGDAAASTLADLAAMRPEVLGPEDGRPDFAVTLLLPSGTGGALVVATEAVRIGWEDGGHIDPVEFIERVERGVHGYIEAARRLT